MTALLCIAIEDEIDLLYQCDSLEVPVLVTRSVPDQVKYREFIRTELEAMFRVLLEELPPEHRGSDLGDFFNSISATVVSLPGVIRNNETLLQLPTWNAQMDVGTTEAQGSFVVPDVLAGIARKLIEAQGVSWRSSEIARFRRTVFVVNDATACAAFEYAQRPEDARRASARYVKLHCGVNIGFVSEAQGLAARLEVPVVHGEAGHGLPIRHEIDFSSRTVSICPYHHSCFEGLLGSHSLVKRAVEGASQSSVFAVWGRHVKALKEQDFSGQKLDNALVRYVLGAKGLEPAGNSEGVDLVAHYTAQLVYQLILNPPVPGLIVLGGRLATQNVVDKVCANILEWACGYPDREELKRDTITKYVVRSKAGDDPLLAIELSGALALARSRVGLPAGNGLIRRPKT